MDTVKFEKETQGVIHMLCQKRRILCQKRHKYVENVNLEETIRGRALHQKRRILCHKTGLFSQKKYCSYTSPLFFHVCWCRQYNNL